MKYICDHYMISRIQRNKETNLNQGLEGTMGYENKGCYKCTGLNPICTSYQTELKLTRSETNSRLVVALGKL